MFSRRLAEYLNNCSISDITAYAEAFPAAKETFPHIVGVVSAGGRGSRQGRTQYEETKRIMVSGAVDTALAKAWEIFRHFYPAGIMGQAAQAAYDFGEYRVSLALYQGEPALARNTGNVFYASFQLEFLIARDT